MQIGSKWDFIFMCSFKYFINIYYKYIYKYKMYLCIEFLYIDKK